MDKKNILICVMIIITLMVLGVAFASNNLVKKNNMNNTGNMTLNKTSNNTTVEHINSDNTVQKSSNEQSDNYMRDANGNIMYAHNDVGGDVPMTKDGHYSYKDTDEPNSPSGWWVNKI